MNNIKSTTPIYSSDIINNQKEKDVLVKANRNRIINEIPTRYGTSILIKIDEHHCFWINANKIFLPKYSSWINIYINPNKEYKNANKDQVERFNGSWIINHIQDFNHG